MDSIILFGCGGCGFQSAALHLAFFSAWMKLYLLWLLGCGLIHARYRTAPKYGCGMAVAVPLVGLAGPAVFVVILLTWFVTYIGARWKKASLPPDQAAILWLSHFLLAGLVLTAAIEMGRDHIYGAERKLARAGGGHIASWWLRDVGKNQLIPTSRLLELAESPAEQTRANALYALGFVRPTTDQINAVILRHVKGDPSLRARDAAESAQRQATPTATPKTKE